MRGDPEVINKKCEEFWDRATGITSEDQIEFQAEGESDARNELKEAMEEVWDYMVHEGWSMEDSMMHYLGRRG